MKKFNTKLAAQVASKLEKVAAGGLGAVESQMLGGVGDTSAAGAGATPAFRRAPAGGGGPVGLAGSSEPARKYTGPSKPVAAPPPRNQAQMQQAQSNWEAARKRMAQPRPAPTQQQINQSPMMRMMGQVNQRRASQAADAAGAKALKELKPRSQPPVTSPGTPMGPRR